MAFNQNHTFEELDGVKCAIVEKSINLNRSQFLKELLEFNGYAVVMVPTAASKTAATKPIATGGEEKFSEVAIPETFTVGVTDVTFNPVNVIFGRMLHTPDGHVVTLAYWQQKEAVSHDEIPYYQMKK